ncbi:MAG: extracellular solute-binding protein [Blastocatellia bacterium]|nr:extracellular solute-binding protein [Blastocatellia bacterium]
MKPYLWRKGETYPTNTKEVDRLFANGEIDFAMSYSPTFAAERIKRGEYPATVRTFVFDSGTISNYSYLTIAFNSANPAGALTVINYLMSVEHLIEQTQELGSTYPHDLQVLSNEQRDKVKNLPRHESTLSPEVLAEKAIPEADSKYLERLEKDWREKVLQGF